MRLKAVAVVILAALVMFTAAAVVELVEARAGDNGPATYMPAVLWQLAPTVCIPPPPPDLDCPEVLPLVNFQALPADPHGLDADKDGIACESP